MDETEFAGMERDAGGTAGIVDFPLFHEQLIVHFFPAKHVSRFREMNPNLMRPTGLQPTFDNRVTFQGFNGSDMRHRPLSLRRGRGTPTQAVSPIADEYRLEGLSGDLPEGDSLIDPVDGVLAELLDEMLFRFGSAGEDHETASISIKSMNSPDAGEAFDRSG